MKRAMNLHLTEEEMNALEVLSKEKEMTKSAVLRQALRLYQLISARLSRGDKMFFEDEKKEKAELMVL